MSRKVLIAYETCYGATGGTSEKLTKVLQGERLDVRVVNISFEMAISLC